MNTRALNTKTVTAIGRWWQVDPIDKFNESLYVGFSNNPTTLSDYLGADTLRQIGPDTYDGGNVVDLVTVSAKRDGNNYDQSYIRYGFKGTFDQWQNRYGFQGWSYDNAMNYWNQAHSADFDRYVYTQDSIEKDRIFREKLWLFSGGWASIGSIYGLGGLGSGALPSPRWFSFTSVAAKTGTQGGLNLFKWGAPQTTKATGWKAGDYMLHLPNKGTPALNWKANYGALRREMGLGKPIFDSYRLPNGNLIPTGGFLNAERSILQGRGWIYNSSSGAWLPPGF